MNNKNIKEVLTYFDHYSNHDFKTFLGDPIPCKWYRHKKNDIFRIVVFGDNMVYQCEISGALIGNSLSNITEVGHRFESFTGGKL